LLVGQLIFGVLVMRSQTLGHQSKDSQANPMLSTVSRPFQLPTAVSEAAPIDVQAKRERDRQFDQAMMNLAIQPKVAIGQPNDQYEQEADQVADQVMSMPDGVNSVQRQAEQPEEEELHMKPIASTITPLVQRETQPEEEEEIQTKSLVQREEIPEDEEPIQAKPRVQREEVPAEEEEPIQTKAAAGNTHLTAGHQFESALGASKSGGSPLPEPVRSFMEPRFGADFSGVRVHTGEESVQMSRAIGAQAFTHGSDVYYGEGKAPGNDALTAHELTHVVQQTGGLIQPQVHTKQQIVSVEHRGQQAETNPDQLPIQCRWTNLGTESWTISGLGGRNVTVWAGSKAEWRSILDNMDDEDEYRDSLQGFLEVSNDPSIVGRTRAPAHIGNVPYQNTITRAPNSQEKLEFLRALYEMAGGLDLWHGGALEGGPWIHFADRELSTFLRNNQGLLIADISAQGQVIGSEGVQAIAEQGGRSATIAMIMNAGATAHKGVELVMEANRQQGQPREEAHAQAMETIRNSGRVIRESLKAHDARVAFQQQVVGQIFDTVWGMIPGGGTLTEAGKAILKAGLQAGLNQAQADDGPSAQAETINNEFVATCNQLVRRSYILSADAQDAINGFEAVRR
jgi:Domain of unknown function (DUF4157)